MSDEVKQPALGQALVVGQVTTLGSLEITAASEIIASVAFGNMPEPEPEPEPAKKPTKPDEDKSTFHGSADYR